MRFAFYEACHWLEMLVAVKYLAMFEPSTFRRKSEFFFGHQTSAEKFAELLYLLTRQV